MNNKFTKVSVGVVLLVSLFASTACQNVPSDKNPVPADPVASTSAPVNTTAPALVPGKGKDGELPKNAATLPAKDADQIVANETKNPLKMNPAELIKNAKPEVVEAFKDSKADTEEGVRFGLDFYQQVVRIQNFYEPRDTKKDWELLNQKPEGKLGLSEMMTEDLRSSLQEQIGRAGHLETILVTNEDGNFGTTDSKVSIDPAPGTTPISSWNTPEIAMNGSDLRIDGTRTLLIVTAEGKTIEVVQKYVIDVKPVDSGWLVNNVNWEATSAKVLNG